MGTFKTIFQQVDTEAFFWCQKKLSKKSYYPLIRTVSASGDGWLYALIILVVAGSNLELYTDFFITCLLGFSLELPLYFLLKHKFKRNRPQDCLNGFKAKIKPSDQFSFPSGHTAAAFVMAIQILLFFPQFSFLALTWASFIGLSRVALGVHFPGDIIAGCLLGTLCSLIATALIF